MKKLSALIILVFFASTPLSYAGYVAEDLGLDLYSKVDAGASELKMKLTDKRMKDWKIKAKLNKELGAMCHDAKGKESLCFSDKEFSAEDMTAMSAGDTNVLQKHKKQWVVFNTDDISEMSKRMEELWSDVQTETSEEQERMEKMGALGIYTDGSLKNSGYDLSADLENIHNIIFAKDIPYPGKDDILGYESFASFINHEQTLSLSEVLNPVQDINSTGPRIFGTPVKTGSGNTSLANILNTCQSSSTPTLDQNLLADIASTLTTGSSEWSTASLGNSGGTNNSWSLNPTNSNTGKSGGDVQDTFPCSGFFCIKIGIETGEWYLLGGGKAYSVEWILDQNLKVVDKFKDSSFIAARFTNDFFELSLKNLVLSALAHIGVVVSSRPAPILNLDPSATPRGSGPTDEQKEFDELQSWILKEFGFDPTRENNVDNPYVSYQNNASAGLSTDELATKPDAIRPPAPYIATKESEIRSRFPDNFSHNLLELSAFSRTFHDYIESLVSLSKKFDEIPQGGK